MEAKISAGYFHFDEVDYRLNSASNRRFTKEEFFWTAGFGVSVGSMVRLVRSQHGVMNISIGYQYFPIKIPETSYYTIDEETTITVSTDNSWWYWGGPGSYVEIKFTLGGIF